MQNKGLERNYTYEDYMKFDESLRCEIIDGIVYNMSPAPSTVHQSVIGFLFTTLWNYLKDRHCRVFVAPFDVFLIDDNQDVSKCNRIVQPDISVICDTNKITEKGCVGAPDLIIEVVSPYNKAHDYIRKLNLYNDFKVREYWIVSPESRTVLKYILDGDNFSEPVHFTFQDEVKVEFLENLVIDLKKFQH